MIRESMAIILSKSVFKKRRGNFFSYANIWEYLAIISLGLMWLYKIKLYQWTQDFQYNFFPKMENKYKNFLAKILTGKRAWLALATIIGVLFFSFILLGIFPRKVLFFPDNIPNQVITYIEYPQGTDIAKTNKATLFVEKQIIAILNIYVF